MKVLLTALSLALSLRLAVPSFAEDLESLKQDGPIGLSAGTVAETPAPGAGVEVPAAGAKAASRPFNVYFIAVGQGDSQYIELPDGQNALIDGGPDEAGVSAFLQSRGVSRINHVVLTHPHADHIKGLFYVFDNLQVDNFYDTKMDNAGATSDEIVRGKAAKEPGCSTYYPRAGQRLNWGSGVEVKVFNSCPDEVRSSGGPRSGAEINNCSIVLKVATWDTSVLFPGDAQSEVESQMVAAYGDELKADVLKVAHHGSAYSSTDEFLARVRPRAAVIEVGKNNYGLPTNAAIGRIQATGALVYRTDQNGTIDGSTLAPQLLAKGAGAGLSLAPVSGMTAALAHPAPALP